MSFFFLLDDDGEALQIWGCGQNRDQTFDIFDNHTIGLSSHPGLFLVPSNLESIFFIYLYAHSRSMSRRANTVEGSRPSGNFCLWQ